MLSEEKKQRLQERVAEWGAAENVPDNILEKVFAMGTQDPVNENDLRTICDTELWSYTVVDWYMKFVAYLEATKKPGAGDTIVEEAQAIRDAIVALQKALEVLERRQNG